MIPRIVPKPQLETAMGMFNLTLQASFAVGLRVPGAAARRGRRSVVRAGRGHGLLRGGDGHDPVPAAGAAGRRAIPASAAGRSTNRSASSARALPRSPGNREVSRPLIHLAAAASLVGVIGVLGPNLAVSLGLDPKNLIVVVLPLGLGRRGGGVRPAPVGRPCPAPTHGRGRAARLRRPRLGDRLRRRGSRAAAGLAVIPLVVVLAFAAGAAYATTIVSAQTALFENMPAAVRGRVFGVLASIVSAASLVPILVAGPLADATSGSAVIAIAATGVLIVAGWSATLFGPRAAAG